MKLQTLFSEKKIVSVVFTFIVTVFSLDPDLLFSHTIFWWSALSMPGQSEPDI